VAPAGHVIAGQLGGNFIHARRMAWQFRVDVLQRLRSSEGRESRAGR
jgi:hypothetical protein